MPPSSEHAALFDALAADAQRSGGTAAVLEIRALKVETNTAIVEQLRGDRAAEYAEFGERCGGLLAEIAKETKRNKFTFAELEEIEEDLQKQSRWLDKVRARDFFPDERAEAAAELLGRCRDEVAAFAQAVYRSEGIEELTEPRAVATPAAASRRRAASRGGTRVSRTARKPGDAAERPNRRTKG